mgnify:FL=1
MNGEDVLEQVRYFAEDPQISHYIEINRALRWYVRATSFPWLRSVDDIAITFKTNVNAYHLGEFGLRSIRRIWYQDSDDNTWNEITEVQPQLFESERNKQLDQSGNETTDTPRVFCFSQFSGISAIRITPTPDADYGGRIDGIVNSPMVGRLTELPGPEEYHDIVYKCAAAYHLENTKTADPEFERKQRKAAQLRAEAQDDIRACIRYSNPGRTADMNLPKIGLMR